MKLFSAYEKGFPYASLAGAEKVFQNIRKAVGANEQAMEGMLGTLSSLVNEYPELEEAIEDSSKASKDHLKAVVQLMASSSASNMSQIKALNDIIYANDQISDQDKKMMEEQQKYQQTVGDIKREYEKLAITIGKELWPMVETFVKYFISIEPYIEKYGAAFIKWGTIFVVGTKFIQTLMGAKGVLAGSLFSGKGNEFLNKTTGVAGGPTGSRSSPIYVVNIGNPLERKQSMFREDNGWWNNKGGIKGIGNTDMSTGVGGAIATSAITVAAVAVPQGIGALMSHGAGENEKKSIQELTNSFSELAGAGAIIGSMFGPMGAAIGALTGVVVAAGIHLGETVHMALNPGKNASEASTEGAAMMRGKEASDAKTREGKVKEGNMSQEESDLRKRMAMLKIKYGERQAKELDQWGGATKGQKKDDEIALSHVKAIAKRLQEIAQAGLSADEMEKKRKETATTEYESAMKFARSGNFEGGIRSGDAKVKNLYAQADKLKEEGKEDLANEKREEAETLENGMTAAVKQRIQTSESLVQVDDQQLALTHGMVEAMGVLGTNQKNMDALRKQSSVTGVALKDKEKQIDDQIFAKRRALEKYKKGGTEEGLKLAAEKEKEILELLTKKAGIQKQNVANIFAEYSAEKQVADAQAGVVQGEMGLFDATVKYFQYFRGNGAEIEKQEKATIQQREEKNEKDKETLEVAEEGLKKIAIGTKEYKDKEAEILGIKTSIKNKDADITNIRIQAIHASDMLIQRQASEGSIIEANIGLMDNYAIGVKASAEMRQQAMGVYSKQLDEQNKQIDVAKQKIKEEQDQKKDTQKLEIELNQLMLGRVQTIQKMSDLSKSMRDGWVDAINAMTIGSGRISKIVMNSKENTGMMLQFVKGAVTSMRSGAVGKGGFGSSEQFDASGVGAFKGNHGTGQGYIPDVGGMTKDTQKQMRNGIATGDFSGMAKDVTKNMQEQNKRAMQGGGYIQAIGAGGIAGSVATGQGVGSGKTTSSGSNSVINKAMEINSINGIGSGNAKKPGPYEIIINLNVKDLSEIGEAVTRQVKKTFGESSRGPL